MKKQLEVVISTKEEAIIAEAAGADRIEISVDHSKNGITQDMEHISGIISVIDIPVSVLIRPNPFTYEYSKEEFESILYTIEICKLANIKGVTLGFLKDGKIDREKLEHIIKIKDNLEINFSRAVDSVLNYEEEIEYLDSLEEISRIHTSGVAETVIDGRTRLKEISKKSKKLVFSGSLNLEGIELLNKSDVHAPIYQVNSGARTDYKYANIISYDMIKAIKEKLN